VRWTATAGEERPDVVLRQLDGAFEEVRRRLRVRLRREWTKSGEVVGGGFHILAHLAEHGPRSPSELADSLEVRTSTMAAHLDRLEEAGYVRRVPRGPGGGRVEVRTTPAGEAAYRRYLDKRQEVLRAVLGALAPDEMRTLARLLTRAVAAGGDAQGGEAGGGGGDG
jgi:DNA-binding MarR family transcriptional regulator